METAMRVFWLAAGAGAVACGVLAFKHGQHLAGAAAVVLGAAEVYNVGSELYAQVSASAPAAAASSTAHQVIA